MKIEDIKDKILPVLKQNHVQRAGVFGSKARGDDNSGSDIDILVKLGKKISLLEFVHLKHKLEDLLGLKVDVVEYQSIKPKLKDQIMNEEIRFYG